MSALHDSSSALPAPQVYYGGTFDPVHLGHLAIARDAAAAMGVPVRMMPAADPPHRAVPGASAQQRSAMLALAVAGDRQLMLDERELRRAEQSPERPSYTIDTLRELRQEVGPQQPLALLIGADSLVNLPGWHAWESLLSLCHFIVADRPGSPLDVELPLELTLHLEGRWALQPRSLREQPAGWVWRMHQPLRADSATRVREAIARGGEWEELVPAAVAAYIREHRLYGFS